MFLVGGWAMMFVEDVAGRFGCGTSMCRAAEDDRLAPVRKSWVSRTFYSHGSS
jgi:hypothetical protein